MIALLKRCRLLILLLALSGLQGIAMAGDKAITAVSLNWEPFYGEALPDQGIVSDIVRGAFNASGVQVAIRFVPWDRALMNTETLKDDVLMGLWYSAERADKYRFSEPFLTNRIVFIKRHDDPFEYTDLESLQGLRIGVVRNYAYSDAFNQSSALQKYEVSNLESNLQKLAANRIDITLEDEIVFKDCVNNKLPALKGHFAVMHTALVEKPLYIAVSKDHPQAAQLIKWFNQGLAKIRGSDAYQRLLQKHGFE